MVSVAHHGGQADKWLETGGEIGTQLQSEEQREFLRKEKSISEKVLIKCRSRREDGHYSVGWEEGGESPKAMLPLST